MAVAHSLTLALPRASECWCGERAQIWVPVCCRFLQLSAGWSGVKPLRLFSLRKQEVTALTYLRRWWLWGWNEKMAEMRPILLTVSCSTSDSYLCVYRHGKLNVFWQTWCYPRNLRQWGHSVPFFNIWKSWRLKWIYWEWKFSMVLPFLCNEFQPLHGAWDVVRKWLGKVDLRPGCFETSVLVLSSEHLHFSHYRGCKIRGRTMVSCFTVLGLINNVIILNRKVYIRTANGYLSTGRETRRPLAQARFSRWGTED